MTRRRKTNTAALENKSLQVQEFGHALDLEIKGANDADDDDVEAMKGRTEALIAQTERMIRDIEQKGSPDTVADMRRRLEALELKANRPAREGRSSIDEDREDDRSGQGFERKHSEMFGIEYKNAMNQYLRTGSEDGLKAFAEAFELKDLSTLRDTDGGFFARPEFDTDMIHVMEDMSPIRAISQGKSISSKSLILPAVTDFVSVTWEGEEDARPTTGSPKFDTQEFPAHESYGRVKITQVMLEDSMVDVEAEVGTELAEQFAIQEGAAFVNGDGVKKPRGFLTEATVANASWAWGKLGFIKSGHASLIAPGSTAGDGQDPLTDLTFALKQQFRAGARWVMNSNTAAVIRKMKDSTGRLLWPDSLQAGGLPPLMGYDVTICEDMPDIASGTFPVAFGNFQRGYLVVDRVGTSIERLAKTDPRYVELYGRRRVGGGVRHYQAIKLLKIAA